MEKLKEYLSKRNFEIEIENSIEIILYNLKQDTDYTKTKIHNVILSILKADFEEITKKTILSFVEAKKFKSNSSKRLLRILFTLKRTFEMYELNFNEKITEIEVKKIYIEYLHSNWADSTKVTNWHIMKNFFTWLNKDLEIKDFQFKNPNELLQPGEMLKEKDIIKILKLCRNETEKTIIALLWDTGARIEEILTLSTENFHREKDYYMITLAGKTGVRFIPCYWSVDILDSFLKKSHDHLFWNEHHNEFSKKNVEKFLNRLEKHSKVEKHLHAHLFRHSRATFFAKFLTDRQMTYYFGWSPFSHMPARYTHLNGYDLVDRIKEIYSK